MPPAPSHSLWTKQGILISDLAGLGGSNLSNIINEIGIDDEESSILNGGSASTDYHVLLEPSGKRIAKDEETSLTDLLWRVLDYAPESRLSAEEVAHHPWFASNENDQIPPVSFDLFLSPISLLVQYNRRVDSTTFSLE